MSTAARRAAKIVENPAKTLEEYGKLRAAAAVAVLAAVCFLAAAILGDNVLLAENPTTTTSSVPSGE